MPVNEMSRRRVRILFGWYWGITALLFTLCILPFTGVCSAEETTTITSDSLEYERESFTYTAIGHVKITKGPVSVEADQVTYHEDSSFVLAKGNFVYEDALVLIKAEGAELYLDSKTGRLFDATILQKKNKFRILAKTVEKRSEDEYFLDVAEFTTCDAPVPAWCFKGKDVDATVNDTLKARDVTFRIKEMPFLYSPYVITPIGNERKTGFLFPSLGYIQSKGVHYEQPFYWAISENRDATFLLDAYAKRGVGGGIEYRFLEPDSSKGYAWVYYLRDNEMARDFSNATVVYDRERDARLTGFFNLNYINSREMYNEYGQYVIAKTARFFNPAYYLDATSRRFMESTGEISLRLDGSRLFLSSQYFIDLKLGTDQSAVAQRLPEVGYFINPMQIGPLAFSLASAVSNFWRETGASGQRLDIYPRVSHAFGSDLIITQSLGLRETAYSLTKGGASGDSPHRESFDYTVAANTRLMKPYGTITHIMEPSLTFTYIPPGKQDLPFFDSTELYSKTSTIEFSLRNRFRDRIGEFLNLRITEAFDALKSDRPFQPLKIEAVLNRPLFIRGDVSLDVYKKSFETANADITIPFPKGSLSIGERYDKSNDISFFTFGASYTFSKTLSSEGYLWYDAKSGELTNLLVKLNYQRQCWGVTLVVNRGEKEYSATVLFKLLGIGSIRI
jgi:LPS-assembly protein